MKPEAARLAQTMLRTSASGVRRHLLSIAMAAGLALSLSQSACSTSPGAALSPAATSQGRMHIVLDPGHTLAQGGATSIRGIQEVHYNDRFVALLAEALRTEGHRVSVTRTPTQDISLDQRTEIANNSGADLFLSIHHDSAQTQFLEKFEHEGRPAWRTKTPIRGHSLFVSQTNPQYDASMRIARSLAEALLALGRKPTLHHAENIAGENRELLDTRLGLYRFDGLLVLRKTRIPAVLLEIGVIVDDADEAWLSQRSNQQGMAQAIIRSLREFKP